MAASSKIARTYLLAAAAALSFVCGPALVPALAQSTDEPTAFEAQIAETKSNIMADPAAALKGARTAGEIASDGVERATSAWLEGEALTRLNRPEEAQPIIQNALQSIERADPDSKLHADLLKSLSAIERRGGRVEEGLAHLHEAYRIYEAIEDRRSMAIALHQIGAIYLEARDYDKVREYYDQAGRVYSDDPALALSAHNNLGTVLRWMGRSPEGEAEFKTALGLAREMESPLLEARILTNLADAQLDQGRLKDAEQTVLQGLKIARVSATDWEPYLWGTRARIAVEAGRDAAAESYLARTFSGRDLTQTDVGFREYHEAAYQLFRRTGRWQEAMQHLEAFKRLDDSGRDLAASTNAALLAAQFDDANRELEISQLEAAQAQRAVELEKSQNALRNVFALLLGAGLLIMILFGAIVIVRRRRRETNEANAKLTYASQHDGLTGLVNRRHFRTLMTERLESEQQTSLPCALLMIDLDRFKAVNDNFGHLIGDNLLKKVSGILRDIGGADATVVRLGGDEFAIGFLNKMSEGELQRIATQVVAQVGGTHRIDGTSCTIGATVGIAAGPADSRTVSGLMSCADLALYYGKQNGRGQCIRYIPEMQHEAEERRELERDLHVALEQGQLSLAYQTIVGAGSLETIAYEALLRWDHPERGAISPAVFIPIAEEARLIDSIGSWVLRTACEEAMRWPAHIRLCVNVSALQVEGGKLANSIVSALSATGLPAQRLDLEVTEGVFLGDQDSIDTTLQSLRALGIGLVMDDFGTGYSSLGYLQRARFEAIKIDRSFVHEATQGCEESAAVIRAIVGLANDLDMESTAEGIEDATQLEQMRALGCTQLQGFHFSRPEKAVEGSVDDSDGVVPLRRRA